MSGVLVPCLMKVIHLQGHIPYVLCTAAPAISGNGELREQKGPPLRARITEKRLCNSEGSCYEGKRPSAKTSRKFLPALRMPALVKPGEGSGGGGPGWSGTREGSRSCYG